MTLPRIWCLLAGRAGDDGQVLALARALGWPFEQKRLHFNWLSHGPNVLLDATLASLDKGRSDPLTPPWPDLVIAAARHPAPAARWIRKQSGGRTRLVHLQYAEMPLRHFDLVVTMPQFCIPPRENVLEVPMPLNRPDPGVMAAAAGRWRERIEALPRPRTALLVGGSSSVSRLDEASAERLGREASQHARQEGGSLLVTTSPRTEASSADRLERALDVSTLFHRWQAGGADNPYPAYLALADAFIVTADSSSLIAEACSTGKPVFLYRAPPGPSAKPILRRFSETLSRSADAVPGGRVAFDWMVANGLLKSPRDFGAFHAALHRHGLVRELGEAAGKEPAGTEAAGGRAGRPPDPLEAAAERVRALFA